MYHSPSCSIIAVNSFFIENLVNFRNVAPFVNEPRPFFPTGNWHQSRPPRVVAPRTSERLPSLREVICKLGGFGWG